MPSFEYDLAFLQAGVPELQAYLLSNEIYWPLGLATPAGERPYPRMTLGWLLLARTRLEGHLSAGQPSARSRVVESQFRELDDTRSRWRIAWEKKAAQEFHARLTLWANFLNDYRGDKASFANQYLYEAQRRVMLHLLASETEIPQHALDLLAGLDRFLQAVLHPGVFVWEKEIAPGFPPVRYWYLYGTLPKR